MKLIVTHVTNISILVIFGPRPLDLSFTAHFIVAKFAFIQNSSFTEDSPKPVEKAVFKHPIFEPARFSYYLSEPLKSFLLVEVAFHYFDPDTIFNYNVISYKLKTLSI